MTNNPKLAELIGKELGVSDWFEITQQAVNMFARVTHDNQWIHTDVAQAQKFMPETGTIVHGFFTMSMVSHLMNTVLVAKLPESIFGARVKKKINYGVNKLRFTDVVPVGSRIRARITINDVEDIDGGCKMTYGVVIETEGREKPALVAECLTISSWK